MFFSKDNIMGFIIHQEQHAHTAFALFCFFVLCPLVGES